MTDEGGPFREQDPVLSRLDKLDERTVRISDDLQKWGHLATDRPVRLGIVMPWVGTPFIIVALAYAATLLFRGCDHGCAESDREKAREADAQAASELRNHERYCAAIGMRFAGLTPVHQDPPQDRFGTPGTTYYAIVCGDGHGDGMFVGADGHLHALKGP